MSTPRAFHEKGSWKIHWPKSPDGVIPEFEETVLSSLIIQRFLPGAKLVRALHRAALDEALVITIDRSYFDLTGS